MRKTILQGRPSMILATLGGAAGVLFFAAALALTAHGRGAAAADAAAVPWAAVIVGLLLGWLVLPGLLVTGWKKLPGDPESAGGALAKGVVFGLVAWAAAGVLLPLLGAAVGWFGAGRGLAGVLALMVAGLGYGVITAAVASMGRGMAPLEAMGWEGHGAGRAA